MEAEGRRALRYGRIGPEDADGDKIGTYLETGETDEYYDYLRRSLSQIKEETDPAYVYVFVPGEDSFTYIMEGFTEHDDMEEIASLGDVYQYKETEYRYLCMMPALKINGGIGKGGDGMREITVPARKEELERVLNFVGAELERGGCAGKILMQIAVAVEEIYINIVRYAYPRGEGEASISCRVMEEGRQAVVRFQDSGIPYNPLEAEEPDVTLTAGERKIGGLGIYMVKKMMDDVEYEYREGRNVLTIRKNLEGMQAGRDAAAAK